MKLFNAAEVTGNRISLDVTHPGHIKGTVKGNDSQGDTKSSFGGLVTKAVNGANDLVQKSAALTQQYITDPDSINVHDVTIAMSEANLAISMTKSVVDNALKAYREIINIR